MSFSKSFSGKMLNRKESASDNNLDQALRDISHYSNLPLSSNNPSCYNVPHQSELLFEKLLSQPVKKPPPSKDFKIWKPDIEALKFECITLKTSSNRLEQQLIEYKLEIQNLKGEVKRLEKYERHYDQEVKNAPNDALTNEIHRRKILRLKVELVENRKELQRLKRIPESTLLKEYDIEKQELIEETVRLKAYIKAQMFEKRATEMTEEVIRNLKEELEKEKGAVRFLESENKIIKAKNNVIKRGNKRLIDDNVKVQEELKIREGEISSLAHENENLLLKRFNQFKLDQETREKEEITNLQEKQRMMEDAKRQLEGENSILRDELLTCKEKEKLNDQQMTEKEENYQEQIKSYRQHLEEVQQKFKNFKQNYLKPKSFQPIKREKTSEIYNEKQKLIKPVNIRELSHECLYLKNTLRRNHINVKVLFSKSSYSISEMYDLLRQPPISFNNQSALLVSRYMIEDGGLESFEVDMASRMEKTVLVSILETMAQGYTAYKEQEEEEIRKEWQGLIRWRRKEWISKIDDVIKVSTHLGLNNVMKLLEIDNINKKQIAFLETQIYQGPGKEYSFSLEKLRVFLQIHPSSSLHPIQSK